MCKEERGPEEGGEEETHENITPVAASCSFELSTSQACQIGQAALCSAAVLPQIRCQGRPDTIQSLTGLHCNLICWLALVIVCRSHSCHSCVDALGGGRCISRGGGGWGGLLRGPPCAGPPVYGSCQTPGVGHGPALMAALEYGQSCKLHGRPFFTKSSMHTKHLSSISQCIDS